MIRLFSDAPQLAQIQRRCWSRVNEAYTVPSCNFTRSSLICSMRRAIPYPWRGPMLSSVCNTMRSRVPCSTSNSTERSARPLGAPKDYYAMGGAVKRRSAVVGS